MTSDNERREVARRLRESAGTAPYMNTSDDFAREVFRAAMNESVGDYRAAVDRLADLIEPGEPEVRCVAEVKVDGERLEKLAYDAVVEATCIDRDALLELADECGDASRAYDGDGHELTSRQLANVARRIREALGVVDGQEP